MTEENKKKPFLVEIVEEYECSEAPPFDDLKTPGYLSIGHYFMFDENKDNVEKRIREELSHFTTSSKKYNIIVKEVEDVNGIYKLGKLGKLE